MENGPNPNPPKRQPAAEAPVGLLRALDACENRAREALRVVEDYVRFVLDDRHLTEFCKNLRHALVAALTPISAHDRLAARETQADVGTRISVPSETSRATDSDLLAANFARLQEALRSLEEFAKRLAPESGAQIEQLRYRSYTLQRAVSTTDRSVGLLAAARLYVLLDGRPTVEEFCRIARELVGAGVHVIQLRDKTLDDRTLLQRGRALRAITRPGGLMTGEEPGPSTLFIMNDRPDLAVLADADGVHVGQAELSVKDARWIVGPRRLVGVSTHSIEQARQAVLDGADYIGVGPTFPSGTKQFDHFPGLALVQAVSAEIRLPAFAIGGINLENLPAVLAAGARRVAVSGAITKANAADTIARQLLQVLNTDH